MNNKVLHDSFPACFFNFISYHSRLPSVSRIYPALAHLWNFVHALFLFLEYSSPNYFLMVSFFLIFHISLKFHFLREISQLCKRVLSYPSPWFSFRPLFIPYKVANRPAVALSMCLHIGFWSVSITAV